MSHKRRGRGKKGWRRMATIFLITVVSFVVVSLLGLTACSFHAERMPANDAFKAGKVPAVALDGDYKGTFSRKVSWQGKEFEAANNSGINNFENDQRYPFKTYEANSLKGDQKVLKIDYSQPKNPLWLRGIVDELVQTGPDEYQGKVYAKLGPLSFTLTYFQLGK